MNNKEFYVSPEVEVIEISCLQDWLLNYNNPGPETPGDGGEQDW